MDVFENGNFYGKQHPANGNKAIAQTSIRGYRKPVAKSAGYTNFVGDDQYANANAKDRSDKDYRNQYPPGATVDAMNASIAGLNAELSTWYSVVCPKQNVIKTLLPVLNQKALICANQKKANISAITGILNDYNSKLAGLQQQAATANASQNTVNSNDGDRSVNCRSGSPTGKIQQAINSILPAGLSIASAATPIVQPPAPVCQYQYQPPMNYGSMMPMCYGYTCSGAATAPAPANNNLIIYGAFGLGAVVIIMLMMNRPAAVKK